MEVVIEKEMELKVSSDENLVTLRDAARWASQYLNKEISTTNISYLIQYGKISKILDEQNNILIDLNELRLYYDDYINNRKEKLHTNPKISSPQTRQ